MNILLLLSKLKRSPKLAGIRKFTNLLYYNPSFVNIDTRGFDTIEVDGCKFYVTDQINSIQRVKDNPWFEGVRSTDVVVDIGANIGAITVPLAKAAKKVYAVEPLFHNELIANLHLNGFNIPNVEVWWYFIGPEEGGFHETEFSSRRGAAPEITFHTLRDMIVEKEGRIDFLKMDGEGCEWSIKPSELKGIRELRIEFHIQRGNVRGCKRKYEEYLDWMRSEGYEVHVDHPNYGPDPYDKEDYMVRATLRGKG